MAFVEYVARGRKPAIHNYIRASSHYLKMSEELWKDMGNPERIKIYYDAERNMVGLMRADDGGGIKVTNARTSSDIKELWWKRALAYFKIVIEKPQSAKVEHVGHLWVFPLSNGKR